MKATRKMVKDFNPLLTLLSGNGFQDVSASGIASQSSQSQWSKPNDAQRATLDNTFDFAFHTGEDARAWWQIDLPRRQPISYIVIENRRNEDYQDRANDISVLCSDGKQERLVYQGQTRFGALPRQLPLIIAIPGNVPIQSVRIEKSSAGALHLSRIRLLRDITVLRQFQPDAPSFVALNDDGLGERLKAMMNAMLMAQAFQGKFLFNWEPLRRSAEVLKTQSIDLRDSTFAPEFIQACHVDKATLKTVNIGEFYSLPEGETFEDKVNQYDGIVMRQNLADFHRRVLQARGVEPRKHYPAIFESIGFSKDLMRVKELADAVDLPSDTVALHLRAGDVIYGPPRAVGRFAAKCFPYPLVLEFIREKQAVGSALLVFGQDEALLDHLKQNFGVTLARDYLGDFNATEAALFEICLMSRCREICAGSSGFAHVASWRGQVPLTSLYARYTPERAKALTWEAITLGEDQPGISPEQKAFACWAALYVSGNAMTPTEADRDLLAAARKHDPDNDLYLLAEACNLYAIGAEAQAEALLETCFTRRLAEPLVGNYLSVLYTLRSTFQHGLSSVPDTWVKALEAAAQTGWPMAAFCMVIIRRKEGKMEQAATHHAQFNAASNGAHALCGDFLNRKID